MSQDASSPSADTSHGIGTSAATQLMRAVQVTRYGAPEHLSLTQVEVPPLPSGCVLVRVVGTSVNPVDTLARRGLLRVATGFSTPVGTGLDYSGIIEEVGPDVTDATVGDRVWGFLGVRRRVTGAAAEFVVARVGTFSPAPTTVDLVDAAALPLAASTALVGLRDHLRLSAADRLLVRGGAGGVGTAAIQLASAMGAHVTALVNIRDLEFVRALGANAALDYRTHTPEQLGEFDAILDVKGTALGAYQRLLSPRGRLVSTAATGYLYAAPTIIFGSRRVRAFAVTPTTESLSTLAGYVDAGDLRPVVDTVRTLEHLSEAHRALEAGGTRGKQVVSIS